METDKEKNKIYGKYTSGTGAWLSEDLTGRALANPFDSEVIDSYVTQLSIDLDRLGIYDQIEAFHVLDIGSGRQALAFKELGAARIKHFDLSEFNVQRFGKHLQDQNIQNIFSQHCDLVIDPPAAEMFDLVYAHGIVQHTSDPFRFIENLIKSTRTDGFIWLYWYQPGSPIWLYYFFARLIIKSANIQAEEIRQFLHAQRLSLKLIDGMLDSFLCPHLHLIQSKHYLEFLSQFDVEIIYQKDVSHGEMTSFRRSNQSALVGLQKKAPSKGCTVDVQADFVAVDPFDERGYCLEDAAIVRYCRSCISEVAACLVSEKVDRNNCLSALQILGTAAVTHNRLSPNAATHKNLRYRFDQCAQLLKH
jgi:2-polyprenyl-3-methyl-5-hydroxy-6-metoxy-1,4-benzoquinol methylase